MDFPGRLVAGFAAIILIIIFPLQYIAQSNNETIDSLVDEKTKNFTDSIRDKGYLDVSMYEEFINCLDITGELYDIEIEDIHPVTGEEVSYIKDDELVFTSSREKSLGANTISTKLSNDYGTIILSDNKEIQSFSSHTHTNDCYVGHRHIGNQYFIHSHQHTYSCVEYIGIIFNEYDCRTCGQHNKRFVASYYWDSRSGTRVLGSYQGGTASCMACGGTNLINSVMMNGYDYSCGYNIDINNDGYNDAVGRNTSYNYQKSTPQNNIRNTYTSGCYSYHNANPMPIWLVNAYGVPKYDRSIVNSMLYYGPSQYCTIPLDYEFGVGDDWLYMDYYVRYRAYLVNGQIELRYAGSNISTYYYKVNFPSTISLNTAMSLMSASSLINFINQYTTCYVDYDVYDYTVCDFYNTLDNCGHTIPNKWVFTCGLTEDTTPGCHQVVTSITATNPNQTVDQGGTIITTATATYLDGHTGIVNCTSNFNPNQIGTQTVTLTYSGKVGNAKTTGTRTCTITVTVKSTKTLSSLTVTPSTQTINRLVSPSFTVTAYYSDGTNKILTSGQYTMTGLNSSVLGQQTVNFSYTETFVTKTATATVYVDGLTSITVTPAEQSVIKYTPSDSAAFTITANYMYGISKVKTSGYVISGYSPSILGIQNVTISYTENGINKTASAKINVTVLQKECPRCQNNYDLNNDDSDPGCPFCRELITGITVTPDHIEVSQGDPLPITVHAIYNDGTKSSVFSWTSTYNPNGLGLQLVTIEYGGFGAMISVWVNEATKTCPICGTTYPISESRCPVCSENVVSITVTPDPITVLQYEPILLTVIAYYADGNSSIVDDWSIDRNSAQPGTFTAKISYGNASSTITLTVISLSAMECLICGLIYEPSEHPKGCPVCSETITGIEAYLTSGSNLVQLGTIPSIAVVLIFRDTHRELTTDGYNIEHYDSNKLGTQIITVNYALFNTSLEIEVVNTLVSITCPNGHIYYLNDDGSDPGCPYCSMAKRYDVVYFFDIAYVSEILHKVYAEGIYYFQNGNYITIKVTKKDKSLLSKIQSMFFRTTILGRKKRFTHGGEV